MNSQAPRISEQQLQAACVAWFHNNLPEHRGMLHCNNNNSHSRIAGNIARTMGVYPGVSDLELILDGGRIAFIELKVEGGVLSDAQKEWREKVMARKHLYFVVWGLEAFQTLILGLI